MNRLACRTALALLLTPCALVAQDSRIADRFPAAVATRLSSSIDSASHEGLPVEPMILRALEGQAKGASTDQIVAALARLRDVLRVARTTLGPASSTSDITVAAAALQAGLPTARLAELHRLRGTQSITAPLGAYLDLTARGAPADRTWNRISDLVRQRASDGDFGRLIPSDIQHDDKPIIPASPPATRSLQ